MTEPELRALEELEARATKGPWIINGPDNSDCEPLVYWLSPNNDDSNEATIATFDTGEHDNEANAEYLGQLRNAAPDLIASARRMVELEAEREAMQLEIDQGREAREMMNDSIDALQSRLSAAEAENARLLADNIRAHEALAPALRRLAAAEKVVDAARKCDRQREKQGYAGDDAVREQRRALSAYDRTAGATDADGGGKSDAQ